MSLQSAEAIDFKTFGLGDAGRPFIIRSEDLNSSSVPLGIAATLRQAFSELSLSAALLQDGQPLAYLAELQNLDPYSKNAAELHRRFWCHGLAPVLLIITPKQMFILSGLVPPKESKPDERLVVTLDLATQMLEARLRMLGLASGELFRAHPSFFRTEDRVDERLLKNMRAARERLLDKSGNAKPLSLELVDRLLCRIVFACYLFDRDVLGPSYLRNAGLPNFKRLPDLFKNGNPTNSGTQLFSLFQRLKDDFNGDMFGGNLTTERNLIQSSHWQVLADWLTGTDVESGQLAFIDYDFRYIPIETISAVYEHFLNPIEKSNQGAYYTPRVLADIVLDQAVGTRSEDSLLGGRYLDPACGSGIFLVGMFLRLAEAWNRKQIDADCESRFVALRDILVNHLCGVDKSSTACRVAAFSLYLALLDQLNPPDLQILRSKGHRLPQLIHDPAEKSGGRTLWPCSFGKVNLDNIGQFDIIIGNPPWVSRKGAHISDSDTEADWPNSKLEIAAKQLAHRFIFSVPDYLTPNGSICFVMPWTILFHHNPKALRVQRDFLRRFSVQRIVNLSDLRFLLFGGPGSSSKSKTGKAKIKRAIHPALIIKYSGAPPKLNASIEYVVPKADWPSLFAGRIELQSSDIAEIRLTEVLSELETDNVPTIWKQYIWGTARDRKLIDLLHLLPRLGARTATLHDRLRGNSQEKPWTLGDGFKPETEGSPAFHDPWPPDTLYLPSKEIPSLILLPSDCKAAPTSRLHRRPDNIIFTPPHVLISEKLNTTFANFPVVFADAIRGLAGPEQDEDLLRFFTAYLNSDLAQYFLFHTSAYWGQERDKVENAELLRLPFPLPDNLPDPAKANQIILEVSKLMRLAENKATRNLLGRDLDTETLRQEIKEKIFDYFDLLETEKLLIDDWRNIIKLSATPRRTSRNGPPAHQPCTRIDRISYARRFCSTLNDWTAGGAHRIDPEQLMFSADAGIALLTVRRVSKSAPMPAELIEENASDVLVSLLDRLTALANASTISSMLRRKIFVFDREILTIIKPVARRNFTQTAALNDADEIFASVISARRRGAA